ncbi:hypothetical protein [Streptomyces sp. NRRL B-24572]|uniref:hypothetical protein n=1 Tax=Streptomyces sp. NRRL B-24572 TaxID=1962156 RepID=UPI0011800DBB|nr:hypothetical protein [Streptomyces sp. NRRL B-24572]
MTTAMTAPVLTAEQVTVALDCWDRPVAVVPDAVAARLAAASCEEVRDYGYGHHESRHFAADSYETRAVRAIFKALVDSHPDEPGVRQFDRYGVGCFYGFVVGISGWDCSTGYWKDGEAARHLSVAGIHVNRDGRSHFGS